MSNSEIDTTTGFPWETLGRVCDGRASDAECEKLRVAVSKLAGDFHALAVDNKAAIKITMNAYLERCWAQDGTAAMNARHCVEHFTDKLTTLESQNRELRAVVEGVAGLRCRLGPAGYYSHPLADPVEAAEAASTAAGNPVESDDANAGGVGNRSDTQTETT